MTIDLTAPAHDLLALLGTRRISAVELVDATIARIERLNPKLNAVVASDFDAARRAATASDAARAEGAALGPLAGLPITVKDAFEVAGLSASNGSPKLADYRSTSTAPAVQRLEAAGAILIGKTNVPFLSGDFQTFNAVHGTTNNPWDVTRTPGGSSGGSAAAIAAGLSALELGTDMSGSIRWPSHACGTFGLRPSWGIVPTAGAIPPLPDQPKAEDIRLTVAGPMARSAKDLALALSVIAGFPETALRLDLPPARHRHPKGLRVALLRDHPLAPTTKAVRLGVLTAATALANAGAEVTELGDLSASLADLHRVFATLMYALITLDFPVRLRTALQAQAYEIAADDPTAEAARARGSALDFEGFHALLVERERLKAAIASIFRDHDVILCPPATVQAVPHDQRPFPERQLDIDGVPRPHTDFNAWASIAALLQLPAAVAPTGPGENGLPTGVQIIAPLYHDLSAIAVAGFIEEALGGYRPPPIEG